MPTPRIKMMTNKVALVLIYNHQYNSNIAKLEYIYNDRFETIFHLVPFYTGSKQNVISVYENSHYFQGYVAQAWRELSCICCDHFLFVADDLLLNPLIDEFNYVEYLGLGKNSAFIPNLIEFHRCSSFWHRCRDAALFNPLQPGIEIVDKLPPPAAALELFQQHGLRPEPIPAHLVIPDLNKNDSRYGQSFRLPYPLVGGYSDIFALSHEAMPKFANLCGLFAASRLFVEVAIPSAMVMACPSISTEKDTLLNGKALWCAEDYEILKKYNFSLADLMKAFPPDLLYIHPIKLSEWWSLK